jgi:hypothetical protein
MLKRHGHLTLTVKIAVMPPDGQPQTVTHAIALKGR